MIEQGKKSKSTQQVFKLRNKYSSHEYVHYEVKNSKFNMKTNISRVDESFTDYLPEKDDKLESKYGQLLGNLIGVKNPNQIVEKGKKSPQKKSEEEEVKKNDFMVYFDISLFEAPPVILKLE